MFAEDKGILVMFSLNEVICVKVKLSSDKEKVMTLSDIGRIRGIDGEKVTFCDFFTSITNQLNIHRKFAGQRQSQLVPARRQRQSVQV